MSKLTLAKGFVSIAATKLPKGIILLGSQVKDGTYLLAADFVIPYDSYGSGIVRKNLAARTLKAGTLIISTEGQHFYRFNGGGDTLQGCGKQSSHLAGALVQQVKVTEIIVDAYKPPAKKKKVAKKKVAKKKKKVTKKKTTARRTW